MHYGAVGEIRQRIVSEKALLGEKQTPVVMQIRARVACSGGYWPRA
jgi:hypothetical protein